MNHSTRSTEPPYRQIVADIRRRIATGELRVGDRIPSTRQIARERRVALATAAKALNVLGQEGLVTSVPRVGTIVAGPEPSRRAPARTAKRTRGSVERELNRDRIVRTAIDIADREGLPAVSMRRVATELGVATMALYRHISGKEELIVLMADSAFGEVELPDPPSDWRAQLEQLSRLQWALCKQHPWLGRVISITRPMPVPNGMAQTERTMRALDGLGLDPLTIVQLAILLASHVQAIAANLEAEIEAEQETGLSTGEWLDAQYAETESILTSDRFPMLASLNSLPEVDISLDTLFERGLGLLLDGIATLVDRTQASGVRAPR